MLLTATILTVLAISSLSYVLGKYKEDKETSPSTDEENVSRKASEQATNTPNPREYTNSIRASKQIEIKAVLTDSQRSSVKGLTNSQRTSVKEDKEVVPSVEPSLIAPVKASTSKSSAGSGVPSQGDAPRDKKASVEASVKDITAKTPVKALTETQNKIKVQEVAHKPEGESVTSIAPKKLSSTGSRPKPVTSTQSQVRDSSPKRPTLREKKSPSQREVSPSCRKDFCPTNCSPLSGQNYSWGYTFANQAPCDPAYPRLF